MHPKKLAWAFAALGTVLVQACDDDVPPGMTGGMPDAAMAPPDGPPPPDAPYRSPLLEPKPECMGAQVAFRQGSAASLISKLEIGGFGEGFDFTGDGVVDNKLAPVGALANGPIGESFMKGELFVLFEWFDLDPMGSAIGDDCVKSAVYLGKYQIDGDGDGRRSGGPDDLGSGGGDCNDHDMALLPGAAEVAGDRVDNDCNGLADETMAGTMVQPSQDPGDMDGDGQSIAAGDCDDRPMMGMRARKDLRETCGDGIDNDCDGVAENGCNPYDALEPEPIAIDPLSLEGMMPKIEFDNGVIAAGTLTAGPSVFSVTIPIDRDFDADFRITGANARGGIELRDGGVFLKDVLLGGVLDARTLDSIKGLEQREIGLSRDNSLLDLIFTGFIAETRLIELPRDAMGHLQPDIDLDGDGLESFWDSNPDDDVKAVDRCTDGDGTVVMDTPEAPCSLAMGPDGKPRFVDGLSVALKFSAVPTKLGPTEPPPQ